MANPGAAHATGAAKTAPTLDQAIHEEGLPRTGADAIETEHGGTGPANHPDPSALGLDGTGWVSLAMAVFLLVLVVKKVPALIARMLDGQIAAIRTRLDEAKALRAEAEALRDDYARRIANVEAEAAAMVQHAEAEARGLIAKAEADAAELTERRARMATDRIAAAERSAVADIRAKAADAAAKAAASLIASHVGPAADRALVDRTIAGLNRAH